jgi:serine protease
MKRIGVLLLLFVSSTSVFAQATRPYLVATRHAGRTAVQEIVGTDIPARDQMNVKTFTYIDAFAADLTEDEVAALRRSPRVRFVEPDLERHAFAQASTEGRNPNVQTQPYGIGLVNAPATWPVTKGAPVNVAVLDSGIDYTHPDLQSVYAGGRNAIKGTDDPRDDNGHGTHCAGTIAAADNTVGVVGVAPQARIWAVKVLDAQGSGRTSAIVAGIEWVLSKKAAIGGNWILSVSLGSCDSSVLEQNEFAKAINSGVLVVAAAGNHNPANPDMCDSTSSNAYAVSYPAAYPGVVAVAAVDATSAVASFSNVGSQVSLAAPGVNVLSTLRVGTGALTSVNNGSATIDAVPVTGTPSLSVTGKLIDCALGKVGDFPAAVSGNIAMIQRGDITFAAKAKNAKAAGAAAVIIYNKDASELNFTLIGKLSDGITDDPADLAFAWPLTIAMTHDDGVALLKTSNGATVTASNLPDDYGFLSGTSMAAPHVAGVAALVWSAAPTATSDAVKAALTSTAHDLGTPGPDSSTGYGLVDAFAAAKSLAPALFSTPAQPTPPPPPPTGRRTLRRG